MCSSSNVGEPSKPLGFEATFVFNGLIPLKPIETYINAVELMAILSHLGWNHHIVHSMGVSGDRFVNEACVFPRPLGTGESSWLPAKYAISGLYQAGVEIANTQRFQQLFVELAVKDSRGQAQSLGYLDLRPKASRPGVQSYQTVATNLTEGSNSNVTVVARPQQAILDANDQHFYITYDRNGHKVKSQDLFTSFLNALSIASLHDDDGTGAFVPNAPSASGNVVLSTWLSGGPSADQLTWRRVKRALQLIWEDVIIGGGDKAKPHFEDFQFELWYIPEGRGLLDGDKIGGGRVMKFGPGSVYGGIPNSTEGIASS
jgi:hypothetical protein